MSSSFDLKFKGEPQQDQYLLFHALHKDEQSKGGFDLIFWACVESQNQPKMPLLKHLTWQEMAQQWEVSLGALQTFPFLKWWGLKLGPICSEPSLSREPLHETPHRHWQNPQPVLISSSSTDLGENLFFFPERIIIVIELWSLEINILLYHQEKKNWSSTIQTFPCNFVIFVKFELLGEKTSLQCENWHLSCCHFGSKKRQNNIVIPGIAAKIW